MKQEVIRIIITAGISALIAILQAYLTAITAAPIPEPSVIVAGMTGAIIAGTRAITLRC